MNSKCFKLSPLHTNISDDIGNPPRITNLSYCHLALAVCAAALSGCADCYDNDLPVHPRTHFATPQKTIVRVPVLSPDLLSPQPEPNCEEKETASQESSRSGPNSDLALRIKLEYDKICYQQAEERTRERLSQLQSTLTAKLKELQKE